MADHERLTDEELVAELAVFGEKVNLPLKRDKRPILLKKLNHFKARAKIQNGSPQSSRAKQNSKSAPSMKWPLGSNYKGDIQTRNASAVLSPTSDKTRSFTPDKRAEVASLDTFSSDDSDLEFTPIVSHSNAVNLNNTNAREKRRISQFSDAVLRTTRRRTAEQPAKRNRRSEMLELSTEKSERAFTNDSFGGGSEDEIPVPSPARSRLYPDIKRFISHPKEDGNKEKFESSDSDLDASTYEVEDKFVNTSFPSIHADGSPSTSRFISSLRPTSSSSSRLNSSESLRQRTFPRRHMNGTHRVQQYRSRYLEILPQILVGIVILFFIALAVTYVVIHKDFFFSWFSSSNDIGSCVDFLSSGSAADTDCYRRGEADTAIDSLALHIIADLFKELSVKKGQVVCNTAKAGEGVMSIEDFTQKIKKALVDDNKMDPKSLLKSCLNLILANPQWNIRALKRDNSEALSLEEVMKLESAVADMTLWCRICRSFIQVLYGVFLIIIAIAGIFTLYLYIKRRLKQQEIEQREVYAMVEKIIDILQDHHEQTKGDDSDEPPYLAVQHVRDQLLLPAERRKRQHIWDKAVDFINANESRIRLETRLIHGDEFEVWHWLQPTAHNGKIWQGQAFGENNDVSNQVIYSPTPCLKIRNMFDSNVESEENWEDNVKDAILEKCRNIDYIVHIYVDVDSREGCVYLKCSSCEAAGKARLALHGWWFDGRLVTVKHLKTDHYHKRWPEARIATKPLKPSTDHMRSLSQPFYRSSLEMT